MRNRTTHTALRIAGILIALLTVDAAAQEIRNHGLDIDENHRLIIEQENALCRVGIIERSRRTGDDLVDVATPKPGVSPRSTPAPDFLVETQVQVLKSSAPNYLQNPGEYYRILVRTIGLEPEYAHTVDVAAQFARDQLFYEFEVIQQEFRDTLTDDQEKALAAAAPLLAEVYKETQLLPAGIYTSVLRSRSGLFRITPVTQQRREIAPAETFASKPRFPRPELGATIRMRERGALPTEATQPGKLAGPSPDTRIAKPRVEPTAADIEEGEY